MGIQVRLPTLGVGDPLADLVYNLVTLPAIQSSSSRKNTLDVGRVAHMCILARFVSPSELRADSNKGFDKKPHPTISAYVDDLATLALLDISVTLETPSNIAELPTLVFKALWQKSLPINTKNSKSAMLVSTCGPTSRQAKQLVANATTILAAGLHCFCGTMSTHLGGVIDVRSSMGQQLAHLHTAVQGLFGVRYHVTYRASLSKKTECDSYRLACGFFAVAQQSYLARYDCNAMEQF